MHICKMYVVSKILGTCAKCAQEENKIKKKRTAPDDGHPSKYWAGPMLLNFSDRTRTGAFNVVWSQTPVTIQEDLLAVQLHFLK